MSAPEAISQRDAATQLGISRATVERWVNQGRLNTIRTGERGGARRVLVDETFRTAQNASRKIPHSRSAAPQKSLTLKNPSRPTPPANAASPSADEAAGYEPLDPSQADADDAVTESLTANAPKSLTGVHVGESLTSQPAISVADRHHRDADLVPVTGCIPPTETASPAARAARTPRRARTLVVVAAVVLIAAVALTVFVRQTNEAGESTARPTAPPHVESPRGGHALVTRPRDHIGAAAIAARGSHAIAVVVPARPAKRVAIRTPRAAATEPAKTVAATRPHRQRPITPCQSAGICVPN